jgi:hypothetical protein
VGSHLGAWGVALLWLTNLWCVDLWGQVRDIPVNQYDQFMGHAEIFRVRHTALGLHSSAK